MAARGRLNARPKWVGSGALSVLLGTLAGRRQAGGRIDADEKVASAPGDCPESIDVSNGALVKGKRKKKRKKKTKATKEWRKRFARVAKNRDSPRDVASAGGSLLESLAILPLSLSLSLSLSRSLSLSLSLCILPLACVLRGRAHVSWRASGQGGTRVAIFSPLASLLFFHLDQVRSDP